LAHALAHHLSVHRGWAFYHSAFPAESLTLKG
jgi:hypothetical protein